jgi:Asp-tRNA(Asn)/Glu-tRNA(Gln) amidotransferase A subunit family amidase
MEPCQLTATQAASLIRQRKLSAEELARSCLARIAARDPIIKAWLYIDPDQVIRNARELDKLAPVNVDPKTALHGIPWGVKDIIDTADMPTTHNSPIFPNIRTNRDAACVSVIRSSGGIILGKADTVEFASGGRKALSRNPYNHDHTPGGSSSGSGAAVGDFHVPYAFGTQTGGSHIRPAAFNGIYAIKPTWGIVSREGVRMSSMTLDTVGWYARCVQDLVAVAETFRLPGPPFQKDIRTLRVGVCRSPAWHAIEPAGEAALNLAAKRLEDAGAIVEHYDLPDPFNHLHEAHGDIVQTEGGWSFLPEYLSHYPILAPDLRGKVENIRGVTPEKLLASYALADQCRPAFDRLFGSGLDVILTPSAPGEAPEGLHTTGNAIFQSMWTLLHVPCVAIPVGRGPRNLPVGIQIVGPRMTDKHLLGVAAALAPIIDTDPHAPLRDLWQ